MDEIEQNQISTLTRVLLEDTQQFREEFLDYPTFEQVQFYLQLDEELRKILYTIIKPKEMAEIFDLVEQEVDDVEPYVLEMGRKYAVEMLLEMSKDDVVDILKQLSPENARIYLKLLPREEVSDIMELFQYPDGVAGALMTTEYVAISATQTVAEALQVVKSQSREAEIINYAYVVDRNECLVGIVSLRELLANSDDVLIPDIMIDRIVSVSVSQSQESVAQKIKDYDLVAIPVVTEDDVLLGIITVDDIIDVIDESAVSDYSGLAGVDVEEVSKNVWQSALQRLPWLIALMLLAMLTTSLISRYKGVLEINQTLSIFITLITGTAGNAGTQALAVTVRKLAIKEQVMPAKFIINELTIGLITGTLTGTVVFFAVSILQQNMLTGFIVAISMLVSILVATLAGNLIPMLIVKFGVDPAVASGPFISTLSDLTSIIIYFGIASVIFGYLS
ncbi:MULTISPECIES: magnesium transporter [unclassified Granulicatella]|uniref:magnesium transporter n=1 Tax=unclassified Granulicatella TaxID=2630493 RepID=UPI0010737567|nr:MULTISPECIES: magnesium transporter [unclassified Granulicatella]MBF0779603.1 magnesium transporter [Granulicatella sp. 19428wC4_WM01]TFU96402.1 magnesium transporter [Granulicatella sp. WM01]